jgi:hypothetical protein
MNVIRQLLGRTYGKATSLDVLLDMQVRQPENRRNLCPGTTPAQIVRALEAPHASQGEASIRRGDDVDESCFEGAGGRW